MPFPNEHAARQTDPNQYVRFARHNGRGGAGIHFIFGVKRSGLSEIQSIRFDKNRYTPSEARAWLKAHDFKTNLEVATQKSAYVHTQEYLTAFFRVARKTLPSYLLNHLHKLSLPKSGGMARHRALTITKEELLHPVEIIKDGFEHDPDDPHVMIAYFLPMGLRDQLALKGGVLASELHVTLAYLGRVSQVGDKLPVIREILQDFVAYQSPIEGKIAGLGRFSGIQKLSYEEQLNYRVARNLFPHPLGICQNEECKEKAYDKHHKDGDASNNSRKNLLFVCRSCHMKLDNRVKNFGKEEIEKETHDVIYASVDAPGLSRLDNGLIEALNFADIPVSTEHDFVPHITLSYVTPMTQADVPMPNHKIKIDMLELVVGAQHERFKFGLDEGIELPPEKVLMTELTQSRLQRTRRHSTVQKIYEVPISKLDEEKHIVYGVVLEPESEDTQGDVISAEEIEKTAHLFMMRARRIGLSHRRRIEAFPVESFLAPVNFSFENQPVKKGSWVLGVKIFDEQIWQDVKAGFLGAFSVGGFGTREQEAA